jgi:hypothetical protein
VKAASVSTDRRQACRSVGFGLVCALICGLAGSFGLIASAFATTSEMYVIWPATVTLAVFLIFAAVLVFAWRLNPLDEIGFIYLGFATLYTILPAVKFVALRMEVPTGFAGLTFATLDWTPRGMGAHFWRHVLLVASVAVGYLVCRGRPIHERRQIFRLDMARGRSLWVLVAIVASCIGAITTITGTVGSYLEHYARLESLSWLTLRIVYVLLAVKTGSYFVLLTWMFGRYEKYRIRLPLVLLAICTYEVVYSHGSRIVAFLVIVAYIVLYNIQVRAIRLRWAGFMLAVLGFVLVSVETVRLAAEGSLEEAFDATFAAARASEFDAVYATGYHLYSERAGGRLPERPPLMAVYELVALVPFFDHTSNHPAYWYAREYFPEAPVPPATMGIIAMSAVSGGEVSLLLQGLLNGALYAALVRWYERRRDKWWILTTYVFLCADSVMILKYSLFYQLDPVAQTLLPALLVAAAISMWTRPSRATTMHVNDEQP